tara:strand:+ start:1765 stop:2214 length:450 start_codon:yes stop_codon:yes gene_type:complete
MASGFIDVASTVTPSANTQGGTDNWGRVTINTAKNLTMPTGMVQWSHLELVIQDNQANQTNRTAKIFLSWDSNGDQMCAGPSDAATMIAGRNDTDIYMAVFDIAHNSPTIPDGATAGTLYLWIQTTNFNVGNNPDVVRARLHWHELSKG